MDDTIFALSSGAPPAAIAIVRVSGPSAGRAMLSLTGRELGPRRPSLARLYDGQGLMLDDALVLWFPGPNTATGEDLLELHCHGGRAVVAVIERALAELAGMRPAGPGEFTRRAFANGRIDLAEAEGLADLLSAETELQRSAAMAMAGGVFSRQIESWRETLLALSAQIEAVLDFGDEDDVSEIPREFFVDLDAFHAELRDWLARPGAERLGEGFRIVLAGPPNSGKSTLFNALVESEAAITSPMAGTTRDVIERSVAISGVPFTFVDTAGLRDETLDAIEVMGVERARNELKRADLVLWLGPEYEGPMGAWEIEAQIDKADHLVKSSPQARVSAHSGENLDLLKRKILALARSELPRPGEAALNRRQHGLLSEAAQELAGARAVSDPLLIAEQLRRVRIAFDRLVGRTTTEDMLDSLFGRFCIGK